MGHNIFYEITAVLLLAGVIALIISMLKQPSIVAFILTGLIVGPLGYYQIQQSDVLNSLGSIGITLLLFMVGLELDVERLKKFGKVALYTGLGQIIFTTIIGFAIVKALGFHTIESFYIATALTFSSTIIVVKLLSEKGDLQSLYGRIVVGFLVVQDFVALGILLLLGGSGHEQVPLFSGMPSWQITIITLIKALIIFLVLYWLSKKVFPKILKQLGTSSELLLSFSMAWALGLAAFMSLPWVGFTMEVGGFIAGLALANTPVHYEIGGKIKSIRDFFIIIFFIVFGTQLVFNNVEALIVPAIVLSLFVIVGNPLILMAIMGYLGYKPRTSFFASVTVAQISEFSFILMAIGYRMGHVTNSAVGLVSLVGIFTISVSSYMILYTEKLYAMFKHMLHVFDFKHGSAEESLEDVLLKNHIILAGAHRLGTHLVEALKKTKVPLVIVDFNPEVAEKYRERGFNAICGDIGDEYIQEQVNMKAARMIISTIPEFAVNMELLEAVKNSNPVKKNRPKLIFAAQNEAEAKDLYEREIDYALSPHFIGGLHLAKILSEDQDLRSLKELKKNHLKVLSQSI